MKFSDVDFLWFVEAGETENDNNLDNVEGHEQIIIWLLKLLVQLSLLHSPLFL